MFKCYISFPDTPYTIHHIARTVKKYIILLTRFRAGAIINNVYENMFLGIRRYPYLKFYADFVRYYLLYTYVSKFKVRLATLLPSCYNSKSSLFRKTQIFFSKFTSARDAEY